MSIKNIEHAVDASMKLELKTVVNIETGKSRTFDIAEFLKLDGIKKYLSLERTNRLKILNGLWMPFTRESIQLLKNHREPKLISGSSMQRCTNLFSTIAISPTHRVWACCGLPVKYIPYLDLGNAKTNKFELLYCSQFEDFMKIWLFVDGPYEILKFVSSKMGNDNVPELYYRSHMCFYCACLFTNKMYFEIARQNYQEKYAAVILRYIFLTKKNRHEAT